MYSGTYYTYLSEESCHDDEAGDADGTSVSHVVYRNENDTDTDELQQHARKERHQHLTPVPASDAQLEQDLLTRHAVRVSTRIGAAHETCSQSIDSNRICSRDMQ